jgi:hypothetical protein
VAWRELDGFLQRNPDNSREWWLTYNTNEPTLEQIPKKKVNNNGG